MKVNIFCIPAEQLANLQSRLLFVGMKVINTVTQDGWEGTFYYSPNPEPSEIDWAETYRSYFDELPVPTNTNYFAVHLFTKDQTTYALSYGKSHFYLRPYCDYDFGIELAKRIADEREIKQTSSKRFQGKKKKDIKSYAANTRLDIESGESVDYLQAAIVGTQIETFGKSGRFGTSALLAPNIDVSDLGGFLSEVKSVLTTPAAFKLPRTTLISDEAEVARFDELLVDELTSPIGTTDFTHNSYDLYGVDFVFSTDGSFKLSCGRGPTVELDELSMRELKGYITDNHIARQDVLKVKVTHLSASRPKYSQSIKQSVDFIADQERVILTNGRWMRFNQDYLEFLDDSLKSIAVEDVEPQFAVISVTEPAFNASEEVANAGYELADKDFSIFRTRSSTPIEAWDLKRNSRVYAVKFATAQKLGYVCDQATAVLELIRNRAGVKQIPDFDEYCLWLGYRAQNQLTDISKTGSIILKQKIDTWARKARELGIEPILKISQKLQPGIDPDPVSL